MRMKRDNYKSLITIPATDSNFLCALGYASGEELDRARKYLEENPFNNKSRLTAVKREIRKRERKNHE